ncbi:MAG: Bax inhibitor-1/YccA family protein [Cellvibrio sp.]
MYEQSNISHASSRGIEINSVLKNTYLLLGLTLAFSTLTAALAMAIGIGRGTGLIMSLAALALIWFVLPRTANSASGLVVVFAFTGLIGASIGPLLNHYLSLANGSTIVLQALAGTAFVFFGLSAYTLISRKNFSFMGGFIAIGMMVMIVGMLFLIGASLFGYQFQGLSLAFSAGVVILMSALILYQTSEIIHGGETNYILATTQLFLSIVNLFTSLLHLLGIGSDD